MRSFGLIASIGLLITLVVGVAPFLRAPLYYPHIAVRVQNTVNLDFLHQGRPKAEECQAAVAVVANVIKASCPTCQVTLQQCSNTSGDEYERLLSEKPVAVPTYRLPNGGVVAYSSSNSEIALLACQESERLVARNQGYRAICNPPNTARTFSSLPSSQLGDIRQAIFSIPVILIIAIALAGYFIARSTTRPAHRTALTDGFFGLWSGPTPSKFRYYDAERALWLSGLDNDNLKRGVDLIFALLGIIIFLPFFLLVPLVIKLIDWRCPVLINISAVGRGGKLFRMHKFSTMVSDANNVLADLLARDPARRKEWQENHKLTDDPRVLPVIGKLLRKFSINELPQLFNVLKGEMSIVGPRPISREEEEKYVQFGGSELLNRRHSIRPGITGLWQISGRNNISYRERVMIDARYLQDRSLFLDLRILLRTVVVVVKGTGAY